MTDEWLDQDTGASAPTLDASAHRPPTKNRDRALLTVYTGANAGQVFAIDKDPTFIGRGREAHIRIEDGGISRSHAKITRGESGAYVVTDLGSRNGTFVNAKQVDEASLSPGDRLQFGPNIVCAFSLTDTDEERLARQLYEASTRDPLTQVFNRRYFDERLRAEIAYATRHESTLAVFLLDIDHFKRVNDTYGHAVGDVVLRAVADKLAHMLRAEDVVARYGGEEFAVLVRGIPRAHDLRLAERIRRAIERLEISAGDESLNITASIGIAALEELPSPGEEAALLLLADERLYAAKNGGRNQVVAETPAG